MSNQALETQTEVIVAEPFDINTLDGIDFPKGGEIIIDSKVLTKIHPQEILNQNGILLPSDTPKKIVVFAKKTKQDTEVGIMANMGILQDTGKLDVAGLFITKPNHIEEGLPSLYTITRIEPFRGGNHKYNHSEMQCGDQLEDPNLSNVFNELVGMFTLVEAED